MKVAVGSTNPMKLTIVKRVFDEAFKDKNIEYETCSAQSDVADQPYGIEETKVGAKNRTDSAKEQIGDADFYVGLEGGIEIIEDEYWVTAWMCVQDKEGKLGFGRTSAYQLPPKVVEHLKAGDELTDAGDKVFATTDIGRKEGIIGILTDATITRADFYEDALRFALIPHLKPELYK